jgi:hypothetical protein
MRYIWILLLSALCCFGQTNEVTSKGAVSWDNNPEPDVIGYRVGLWTGDTTNVNNVFLQYPVARPQHIRVGLDEFMHSVTNGIYSLRVLAFNSAGLESAWSERLVFAYRNTVPASPENFYILPKEDVELIQHMLQYYYKEEAAVESMIDYYYAGTKIKVWRPTLSTPKTLVLSARL